MYKLELLHVADQEAGAAAVLDVPNFSAVLNALRAQDLGGDGLADNTITLSSGDAFIPGLFYGASEAAFGSAGIADIQIQNELGIQAIAFGNHEFDFGSAEVAALIDGSADGTVLGSDFQGALFPYLSTNLDFSSDASLAPLEVDGGQAPLPNSVTSSTVIDVNGESIGVVGATTPTLASISSPDGVGIAPSPFGATPTAEQIDALAAEIQLEVDALLAANLAMDKVIVLAHMQQISIEFQLATRLSGVDVIVAGGSNTRLFDENDRARPGDSDQGTYPQFFEDADGNPIAVVNTDGSYKYVGRLVIDFDDDGNIITESYDAEVSGAYATDDQGVLDLGAEGLADPEIQKIVDAIEAEIIATESNVFGISDVFLNGNRSGTDAGNDPDGVRTQETNLGNLTADANLAAAKEEDPDVLVSLKNGGGIRASIGQTIVPPGGSEAERTANEAVFDADGNLIKPAGGISQNDIQTTLAFNNDLVLLTLTKAELVELLEHGVGAIPDVSGRFPQVAGVSFSYDPDLPEGDRIINAQVTANDGSQIDLVVDGELAGDPAQEFRIVTLGFLAESRFDEETGAFIGGGDGYPFPNLNSDTSAGDVGDPDVIARIDFVALEQEGVQTGNATFADDGTEQDALAEYLFDNHNTPETAFDVPDRGVNQDQRIDNLTFTDTTPVATDTVVAEIANEFVGEGGETASEVVAFEDGKLYVTNGALDQIDIFDLADAGVEPSASVAAESAGMTIPLGDLDGFAGVQSVAVKNDVVAAAIRRAPVEQVIFGETVSISQPGFVALFDAETGELLATVDVGNLPDAVTFTPDGTKLLVAGEGEFNADSMEEFDDNPLGTIAIVDVTVPTSPVVNMLDSTLFDNFQEQAEALGIRLQEGIALSKDVEPEYISVTPDGTKAYVTLQENNAVAVVDLTTDAIVDILPLGTVDFNVDSQLDALDDDVIDIRAFNNLVGLRMPDAIATFEIDGQTYFATANEGDSRDFDEDRVGDLAEDGLLDPALKAQLEAEGLIDDDPDTDIGLERLEVSTLDGDTDGDGDIDVLHTFSSRSFSIFDGEGNLVFDSGAEFAEIVAKVAPERFLDDDGGPDQNRADAKGSEPEAIAVGQIGAATFAFIGLERDSGIMIYDITSPARATFVNYIPGKFVDLTPAGETAAQGPEVITFIPASASASGLPQIAVAYEISGTTIVYDLFPGELKIGAIQGAAHVSPVLGNIVKTTGIVTAVDFNGYYLQDRESDGDDATSDAIFVFVGNGNTGDVEVGDELEVTGTVSEFIPGGAGTGNLSITQLTNTVATELSTGNDLPEAVIVGEAGRMPPTDVVISADETPVNLQEEAGTINPDVDGIDFYESLEGMLVTVANPVTISATNGFDETWLVADEGANVTSPSGGLNDRGGLIINADIDGLGDLNPERIQIQYDAFFDLLPDGFTPPSLDVGQGLTGVTGVVSYAFGNFEVLVTQEFEALADTANDEEVTDLEGDDFRLSFATYNVLNVTADIDGSGGSDDDADQIAKLAEQIADNLGSPDIVALQEIQDDSGTTDDGTLGAEVTLQALVDAIALAGGPTYAFESAIVDENNENGGAPGSNIRNAFLWNTERMSLTEVVTLESDELAARGVTDADPFFETRDPLLGVFEFNGEDVTVINNHFSSRFGSEPIFGGPQPFLQAGEEARAAQAAAINTVVDGILAGDPGARVIVAGDLNTFEFTDELAEILPGTGEEQVLTNLIGEVGTDDAYSFIFDGNSQALDHIFVTDSLLNGVEVDYVHLNVDFAAEVTASDHEPIVASFQFEVPVAGATRGENLFAVNAGGDAVSGFAATPNGALQDFEADTGQFVVRGGDRTFTDEDLGGTSSIAGSERWDVASPIEMLWQFDVGADADVIVDLYFNEIYEPVAFESGRLFDVLIENDVVLDDFDITTQAAFGELSTESFRTQVGDDGILDIEFLHEDANNPKISAIAIYDADTLIA